MNDSLNIYTPNADSASSPVAYRRQPGVRGDRLFIITVLGRYLGADDRNARCVRLRGSGWFQWDYLDEESIPSGAVFFKSIDSARDFAKEYVPYPIEIMEWED